MRILGIQLDSQWESVSANLAKLDAMLKRAGTATNEMVVLPEMFATGFTMNTTAATAKFDAIGSHLRSLAARHGCCIVAGAAASGDGGPENRAVVFGPTGELATYSKLHPFSLGGEKQHYRAGRKIITFDWQGFVVAPIICYDLRFPEIFRAAATRGVTLFTVIANWPISRAEHWMTLLRARAIENQAYVIGVNRVGRDPNTLYGGRSVVVDPMGIVRADAGDAETTLSCEIDPAAVAETRAKFPFLADRRTDF
jgi:predicted amidohydrolase